MNGYFNVGKMSHLWEEWKEVTLRFPGIFLTAHVEHVFEYRTMQHRWSMRAFPAYTNPDFSIRMGNEIGVHFCINNDMIEQITQDQLRSFFERDFRNALFDLMEEAKKDPIYCSQQRSKELDQQLPPITAVQALNKKARF